MSPYRINGRFVTREAYEENLARMNQDNLTATTCDCCFGGEWPHQPPKRKGGTIRRLRKRLLSIIGRNHA